MHFFFFAHFVINGSMPCGWPECYVMLCFSTNPSSDGQAFLGARLRKYFDPVSNVNRSDLMKCSLDVNYLVC